jgi:hypothetical protein
VTFFAKEVTASDTPEHNQSAFHQEVLLHQAVVVPNANREDLGPHTVAPEKLLWCLA